MSRENPTKQSVWGRFFQTLITWTVYFLFRPRVVYKDKSLKKSLKGKPAVFVLNHTHHFDGAYAGAVLGRFKPYVLVKKQWYEKKTVGKMISWCRCIPISLDEMDAEWFGRAEKLLSEGRSIIIFPEGGLAREGHMEPFKAGAGLLSAKTGAPVVPCAIHGGYHMVFGRRQTILVGEPIESNCPADMRHSKYARGLMAQAQTDVGALYDELTAQYGDCGTYSVKTAIMP